MGTIDGTVLPPSPLDVAHRRIEAHAGWLTLFTALLLVTAVFATVMMVVQNWVLGTAAGLFMVSCTIMFTRPLGHVDSDATPINAVFRFAYAFIFTVLILGGVALFDPSALRFSASSSVTESEKDGDDVPRWIPTVIAIVPGCDYLNLPKQNVAKSTPSGGMPASARMRGLTTTT